jgi:hypothetical protein
MSTPDRHAQPTTTPTEPLAWTDEDVQALFASMDWFDMRAPSQLLQQYKGKHVAIFGEEVIDADRDGDELYRRVAAKGEVPINRVLFRLVPTGDEPLVYASPVFIGAAPHF